jgi:hypothetical protein
MKAASLIAAALAAALAGCGAAPLEYHRADDMKPGPGMISGEKGEFVYRVGAKEPAAAAAPAPAGEAEEFERWKRSAAGTDEYREFQDWREWRDWKRRNAK